MGTFNSNKVRDRNGNLYTSAQYVGVNLVDRHGTLKSKPQFVSNKIPDINGNLGSMPVSGPWEMQLGTVENIGADLSHITTNYALVSGNLFSSFVSQGTTGYYDGVASGPAAWDIQGGPQTIGGVSYPGGGLLIATQNNTVSGLTRVMAGARLQLGETTSSLIGRTGPVNVAATAILDVFGGNTANVSKVGNTTNAGTINWTGPGVCGAGIMQIGGTTANNGVINIDDSYFRSALAISGTGTINVLDGGTLLTNDQAVGSGQTLNLNGCGWCDAAGKQRGALEITSSTATSIPAKINIQTETCIKTSTAFAMNLSGLLTGSAPLTISSHSATVPSGTTQISNTGNTYNGTITVDGTTIGPQANTTSLQYARINLENGGRFSTNGGQTVGSIEGDSAAAYFINATASNLIIKNNGITTFAGRLLRADGSGGNYYIKGPSTNQLTLTGTGHTGALRPEGGAKLILQGATVTGIGQIWVEANSTISAGTSVTAATAYLNLMWPSSILEVRAISPTSVGLLTATVFDTASNAFKVDIPDALQPGTYPILKANSGTGIPDIPTTGVNNTGLTATYSWSATTPLPRILSMTLA